jgi:uncharacterized protein YegJ (DUF2314 family)
MTRFLITIVDPEDNTTHSHGVRAAHAAEAIIKHKWITDIYKDEWVRNNILAVNHEEATISNVFRKLGWVVICNNLDEVIMKDLNGGDSSYSSSPVVSSSGN